MLPKVAVIYLSFHCEPYIDDVVSSLKKITYPKDRVEFVIVDNPHPTHGSSIRFLEENVMPMSGKEIPHVTLLPQNTNLGFAGGNNVGIRWALENGFDYVYFHNNDGFVAANFLEPLVNAMENDKTIGVAQSLLLLYPETDLVNSSGNAFHYLGLAYCQNFRARRDQLKLKPIEDVGYASGASLLMRADLLKKFGLWDEDYYLYHEDLEYSLRLRTAGYRVVMIPDSVFYHKYSFSRNKDKFYYMERNRFGLMLTYFRWPTLILLLPMALVLEIGLWLYSFQSGFVKERLNIYKYWLQPKNWVLWLSKRKNIFAMRVIKDKTLLDSAVSQIIFDEKSINNPLLVYIGNPLMAGYAWIIKKIIFW